MEIVLVTLVLTAVTLVAVARAMARVADEADQLRAALVRVDELRPVIAELGADAHRLGTGISRLGR